MIMEWIINGLTIFLVSGGLFFLMVGSIGLIRLPDVFSRMHATTKADTLGAGLVLIGMMLWQGFSFLTFNILIILLFVWITNPTAAHFIAKTQYMLEQGENGIEEEES